VELVKPDLCVIGAGAGGLDAAAGAALAGKSVVLVEQDKFGGRRLTSAVPSRALIAAARAAHRLADAEGFGLTVSPAQVDFDKLRAHLERVVAGLAMDSSKERFTGMGVRVIEGAAQFINRRRLAVGEAIDVRAQRYVIATGSLPALPEISGLAEVPYLTDDGLLGLAEFPRRLVVIGASAVGLELAQAFRRLGADVTVLDTAEPLAQEDAECARVVLDALTRDGVTVRGNVAIESVAKTSDGVAVTLGDGQGVVSGTHLLIACGRRPNVDGLALDKARVKLGPQGIIVNPGLRTSNRHIYALGAVTGAQPFIHVARQHAGLIVQNALFGRSARVDAEALPRLIMTDPELAHVGLTDAEAERRKLDFRVLRWPYAENDRARIERAAQGHIKVVTSRRGRVLGVTIVGEGAGDMIAIWSHAVGKGVDIRALAGILLPYPTFSDIGKRAATTYLTLAFKRTWARRILGLLGR
jgi:pyruvate/2-oxoglutarate dehydrogenase complex dihydrolipoamide dehydrogenase (E3) component